MSVLDLVGGREGLTPDCNSLQKTAMHLCCAEGNSTVTPPPCHGLWLGLKDHTEDVDLEGTPHLEESCLYINITGTASPRR